MTRSATLETTKAASESGEEQLLEQARAIGSRYIQSLPERFVGSRANFADLLERLGGSRPIPDRSQDASSVIAAMADAVEPGLVATAGPRYFGLVIGGALPVTVAADWLTSAWEQHAFSFTTSPAAAAVEEVCRRWLAELLGLAPEVSLGLVTGATMANFTCLATARHATLASLGWDVEERGLTGAPPISVITSDESHATIFAALQMLGLGRGRAIRIPTDDQGRLRLDELRAVVSHREPPVVVCAQAGNVNTGAFDPLVDIASIVHEHRGWLHVDSAFGAWAAASARYRHLAEGIAAADSLSLDAHKWLNVPYDCGFAFTRHPESHRAAMSVEAPYYDSVDTARNNHHFVPESSRRARGFTVYAALRSLARSGVEQLVDRCCSLARRIADRLEVSGHARILNDVVLNQVLVQFKAADGDDDGMTARVIRRVQDDGTCWIGGSSWHGRHVMRISVSNWSTTEADIDRSAEAMLRAYDDCIA